LLRTKGKLLMTTDTSPIKALPGPLLARGSDVAGAEWGTYGTPGPITDTVQGKG
jgi:hypothetical protein